MQQLITKYGLAAHLALIAVAPLFLSPICVLWLCPLAAVWIVMEPSRIEDEMLHDARERVMNRVIRDPLTWLLLVVVGFTAIRWYNGGVAMVYNAETSEWSISQAQWPLMPFSVRGYGAAEFVSALVLFLVTIGGLHALGRSARMVFLALVSIILGGVAFTLMILAKNGHELVSSLLMFNLATPLYPGLGFGMGVSAGSIALLYAYERSWRLLMPFIGLGIAGNAAGLVLFSPLWAACAMSVVNACLFLYAFIYARMNLSRMGDFKYLVGIGISLVIAGLCVAAVFPKGQEEMMWASVVAGDFFPKDYDAIRTCLNHIAERVWLAHPWLGSGLGSFLLDIRFTAAQADWAILPEGQMATLNGYWGVLAERGVIGMSFIVCPLGFILWKYVKTASMGLRLHLMPHPAAWSGILLLVAVLGISLFDSSYSYSGTMTLTAVMLTVSVRSFPKEKQHG